jgi:alkylated DNA repair dioxygenase AlkB
MQHMHGWLDADTADAVLAAVRPVVVYGDGDDRTTGHVFIDGDLDWAPDLQALGVSLLGDLEDTTGVRYPIVAFQGYRDGAGCDWHADTPFGAQAILSLGVTRYFEVDDGSKTTVYPVKHGDLFVMPAGTQETHRHRVPTDDTRGERVSLVFRTPR